MPQIDKDYIKTGKAMFVLIDSPLDFHKQAFKASEAAYCAGEQGRFWEMHDKIFAEQRSMGLDDLKRYAQAIGLDMQPFNQCLDSNKYADKVQKGIAEARKVGVSGVPAFFIGYVENDGNVRAVKQLKGAQPYAAFKEEIEKLLTEQK